VVITRFINTVCVAAGLDDISRFLLDGRSLNKPDLDIRYCIVTRAREPPNFSSSLSHFIYTRELTSVSEQVVEDLLWFSSGFCKQLN
jgi:hypothetical protein